MLSKNKAKFIKSLQDKKYRNENDLFLVEGAKSTLELLKSSLEIKELFLSERFYAENQLVVSTKSIPFELLTEKELSSISSFGNNNAAVALVKMQAAKQYKEEPNEWVLILDSIQDPGNLGTIIRIADWYGIKSIICSDTTTDQYSPKVISATMGSFTRITLYYENIEYFLKKCKGPIYAAHLNGENMHTLIFPKGGYLLMGNESLGIKEDLMKLVTKSIKIPKFGEAESLNVAIATAVICDSIRRSN